MQRYKSFAYKLNIRNKKNFLSVYTKYSYSISGDSFTLSPTTNFRNLQYISIIAKFSRHCERSVAISTWYLQDCFVPRNDGIHSPFVLNSTCQYHIVRRVRYRGFAMKLSQKLFLNCHLFTHFIIYCNYVYALREFHSRLPRRNYNPLTKQATVQ
jgi:hypothetical protein